MAASTHSPRSTLRKSILATSRSRGHQNYNLWLVYSVKTNQDWTLPSDRQLIHWLYFLEANSDVQYFDLAPEPIASHDKEEARFTELDAIVHRYDGTVEWHEVKSGKNKSDPTQESQQVAQLTAASAESVRYKRFNDSDIEPVVKEAMRWHKAISFAAAIRNEQHILCRTALVLTMRDLGQGEVSHLLNSLASFDPSVVLGMLVRLTLQDNIVSLDLKKTTFGLQTKWFYHE